MYRICTYVFAHEDAAHGPAAPPPAAAPNLLSIASRRGLSGTISSPASPSSTPPRASGAPALPRAGGDEALIMMSGEDEHLVAAGAAVVEPLGSSVTAQAGPRRSTSNRTRAS